MRRAVLSVLMVFVVSLAMDSPSARRGRLPAQNADPVEYPGLCDLVPASAMLAIEFRDLERRWQEIRRVEAVAGMDPALAPGLMGSHAVIFLVRSEQSPFVVPIAILRPADFDRALATLAGMRNLSIRIGSAALWLGPAGHEETLEFFLQPGGARLAELLPLEEMRDRLPAGGMIRGWVNPPALRMFLRSMQPRTGNPLLQWPIAAMITELDVLRYMVFRRDFEDGTLMIDGIAAYDPGLLPPELSAAFDPESTPVPLPAHLPSDTMAIFSFRPEAQTWIPWMRTLAANDARGPLRNLGFWLDEFQERYHRDLHRILLENVGEGGWLVAQRTPETPSADVFCVIEVNEMSALEETLMDGMSWMAERIRLETFGTVFARPWREIRQGRLVHGMTLHTPISTTEAPAFEFMEGYLIIGGNPSAMTVGRAWVESLESPVKGPEAAGDRMPVHAALAVQPEELAKLVRAIGQRSGCEALANLCGAMAGLAADLQDIRLNMSYERDGIRMHGRIRIR